VSNLKERRCDDLTKGFEKYYYQLLLKENLNEKKFDLCSVGDGNGSS
jgi:hypothetical protein